MSFRSMYVVTVKLNRNIKHDPHNKIESDCPYSEWCTDSTGNHHSFIMIGYETSDIERQMKQRHPTIHITRIEKAKYL